MNLVFAWTWLTDAKPKSTVLLIPGLLTAGGAWLMTEDAVLWVRVGLIFVAIVVHLVVNVLVPWLGGAYGRWTEAQRSEFLARRRGDP